MTGRVKLCGNLNPLQSLTFDGTTWWNEDLSTRSRTENGCYPECKGIKMLGPDLATCQLASWAENVAKFKLKLSENWKRKPNKSEVGMDWETKCGECKWNEMEFRHETLWKLFYWFVRDVSENNWCNGYASGQGKTRKLCLLVNSFPIMMRH